MASVLTFSPESAEFRDYIEQKLSSRLRELAIARAKRESRTTVTKDDFSACLEQAVQDVLRDLNESVHAGE